MKELEENKNKLVIRIGKVTKNVKQLITDLRKVFEPHVALKIQEHNNDLIEKYIPIIHQFFLSHFFVFTEKNGEILLRISNYLHHGPTYFFKIENFKNIFEINKCLSQKWFKKDPIVTFSGDDCYEQNIFKNLEFFKNEIKDENILRNIHLHFENKIIYFRHYFIKKEEKDSIKIILEEIGPSISMSFIKEEDGFFNQKNINLDLNKYLKEK
ncbi:Brix domain-containing protein [Hamiltosporidium magnivora]|uniref:Brix domain-containing protein n=2 Tax=Hamiltosporidium TaxID=1176354 RepID=A0A4Q9KZ41_9MICR|nr:Brix domain-containing protein [Hamiltosporidium magnivora]